MSENKIFPAKNKIAIAPVYWDDEEFVSVYLKIYPDGTVKTFTTAMTTVEKGWFWAREIGLD